jgi:hypothetical protein
MSEDDVVAKLSAMFVTSETHLADPSPRTLVKVTAQASAFNRMQPKAK